jgi:hypothetical protein
MLVHCHVLDVELLMQSANLVDNTESPPLCGLILRTTNFLSTEHLDTEAALGTSSSTIGSPLQRSCSSYQSVCGCRLLPGSSFFILWNVPPVPKPAFPQKQYQSIRNPAHLYSIYAICLINAL